MVLDVLLAGGEIADGSGAEPRRADVGIKDGTIALIGAGDGVEAVRTVDVRGRLLLPGLVDAHSHAEGLIGSPELELACLRQGVTTVVLGQDGVSVAPSSAAAAPELSRYFAAVNGPFPEPLAAGATVAQLLEYYDRRSALNVAYLAPAGTVRASVAGFGAGPADPAPQAALLEHALDEGAVGLSTGLEYVPGGYAGPDELSALLKVVSRAGGVHVSHIRGYEQDAPRGMAEFLALAAESGVRAHVSHFHGPADLLLPEVSRAHRMGVDLTYDTYPYRRGNTLLAMLALPRSLQDAAPSQTLARLADASVRESLRQEWFPALAELFTRVTLSSVPAAPWAEGLTVPEAAARAGQTPGDLVCDLILASDLAVACVVQQPAANTPQDIRDLLKQPEHMGSSDGILVGGHPHPRGRGAFARMLARHTRDLGDWTWGQAAVHLSSRACERFGLAGRGRLEEGYAADVAVLEVPALADRATYAEPLRLAEGVELVLVNGQIVLEKGQLTGGRCGRALRRGEKVR
ncbi:N-acyl-D-aspartate/D-glutamate deacylase [Kineosporia sp. NBRC 101677]|uniref:N-acyl-D-amino-acid deacylase family protein n=1 Tax=Kineosporia sp. NBRC 101677 TaxID=3032197 RepID=UPI0024A0C874|nr:amidohydrolase family protein [Kineosporia sp. NBRC 101677]GLY18969.1 N-acyl-D-aspartate/D-glutamate deacylase [Kineosporia sp. NBRC 101677]